ncbi:MAG: hypothetical protein ACP5LJ_03785 [Candidatus Bipolaricaulaceae bacterium]
MKAWRSLWFIWFSLLVSMAFLVPYTVLRDVHRLWGSFLFWNVFALLSIFSVFVLTGRWRD